LPTRRRERFFQATQTGQHRALRRGVSSWSSC
jgi:hypothetical protein